MNYENRFHFMRHRNKFFIFSLVLTVLGIAALLVSGLNLGVDFKAGTAIDANVGKPITKPAAEKIIADAGFAHFITTVGGNNGNRVSVRFDEILSDADVQKFHGAFVAAYGDNVSQEVNTVQPDMAQELGIKAIIAIAIASLAISIYVSIRFEWRFALAAVITILYDAFFVISLFALFRLEVDLPFIAAILTTIGYSINDKIVIFDRIRENLRFAKLRTDADIAEVIHTSIWQTMRRNVYTVVTVLVAAGCLFAFGSPAIKLFALAKIFGLASGAYSSICIASPLWFLFKKSNVRHSQRVAAAK